MPVPGKLFLLLIAVILVTGCKHRKKPSLTGDEPVEISDFIEFFRPVSLPYQLSDTVLTRKEKDSALISYQVFTQFVPDSILSKVFGKGVKPRLHSLARAEVKGAETYLFAKAASNDKKAVFILAFDKKQQFIAGMTALRPDNDATTQQSVLLDRKYTITKSVLQKKPDGSFSDGKDVYVLNAEAKNFMLIMTDALNDKITELINPIDTLPRKGKFSADYSNAKMNLVSVRDGRKTDRISFFIHFEKNNGECTGELKGEAMLRATGTAEYRQDGDPCVLKFIFSKSLVTLKEEEGCGSRRGLQCSFNGSFARKKYVKPATNQKVPVKR
ncbi:MAG: hypothetical protein ABIT05_01565 [Chitinophagaceae bacterium]